MKSIINAELIKSFVKIVPLIAISGMTAHASNWNTCDGNPIKWNDGWTNMYISTTSFPAGSAWDARLQNAMWHWNNVKGSSFNFYYGRDSDGKHSNDNGVNEIYVDNSITDSSVPASTYRRYHCYWAFGWHYGLDEADIGFNNHLYWSNGPSYSSFRFLSFGSEDFSLR